MNGSKIAIVCDWLVGGGAEKVVQELHTMYPNAPVYTSYCSDEWRKKLDNKVVTGYLQKWPFSKLRKFLPVLRHFWFKQIDLTDYDIVISCTGNGEAKQITTKNSTKHLCYCFTPTHFYWRQYNQYIKSPGFGWLDPIVRLGLRTFIRPLKKWDHKAAQKVDSFVAISRHIQSDIEKYYKRDSTIIHPPVDVQRFHETGSNNKRSGFITVGRQVPYKRVDLLIQACNQLHKDFTVIGRGPEHEKLKKMAGPTIRFLTNADDETVVNELQKSEAFLFASLEDFGIAPVEAMAAGTPVIAYKAGGALDYVIENKTGVFFQEQTVESAKHAIQRFEKTKFSPQTVKNNSKMFSNQEFTLKMTQIVALGSKKI